MKDFTQGSILRHIITFSVPLLLSNLAQALYSVVDAVWVGRLLGHQSLAAVSTGTPVLFLTVSLIIGLTVATTILAGRSYGAKDYTFFGIVLSNSLFVILMVTVVLASLIAIFTPQILVLINTPPTILGDAAVFLRIILFGLVFNVVYQWLSGIFNGIGDSKTPFYIFIITLGINVILAPILIVGFWIVPPLGIEGSALATVISGFVGSVIAVYSFRRHSFLGTISLRFKPDSAAIKKIFLLGIPMSLQMIVVSGSALLVMTLVNRYGENTTAAYGIGTRVDQFVLMAIMAISMAVSTMTAQNLGAGIESRVREIARWAIIVTLCFGALYIVLACTIAGFVASFFTQDTVVIAKTIAYFKYACPTYVALAILFSLQGVARGAGDTVNPLIIIMITMIVFRLPLCYLFSAYTSLQENGLWLGVTVSSFAGAALFVVYYKRGTWKKGKHSIKSSSTGSK